MSNTLLPQKRPLTTASTNQGTVPMTTPMTSRFRPTVVAPPPKTATVKRLERLLDEPAKKKKTMKTKLPKVSMEPGPVRSVPLPLPLPVWVPPVARPVARPLGNALAFRGGLSSAPTFKKATVAVVKTVVRRRIPSPLAAAAAGLTITSTPNIIPPLGTARRFVVREMGTTPRHVNGDDNDDDGSVVTRHPMSIARMDQPGDRWTTLAPGSTTTRTSRDSLERVTMDDTDRTDWSWRDETGRSSSSSSAGAVMARRCEGTSELSNGDTIQATTRNQPTIASTTTTTGSSLKIGLQLGTTRKAAPYKRSSLRSRIGLDQTTTTHASTASFSPPPPSMTTTTTTTTNESCILQVIHVPDLPPPRSMEGDDRSAHDNGGEEDFEDDKQQSVSRTLQQTHLTVSSESTVSLSNPTTTTTTTTNILHGGGGNKRSRSSAVHDNFVRLNLRNSAGVCRGARNKKLRRKSRYDDDFKNHSHNNNNNNKKQSGNDSDSEAGGAIPFQGNTHGQAYVSRMSGLDPMDDYLDGVYTDHKNMPKASTNKHQKTTRKDGNELDSIPICARHNRPCKLVVVKKNTKGNKGRKFYACSMPRGEQCDHFEWAEDTFEAARKVVEGNSSHSSFVARQVLAHVDRFRVLTLPELREEAATRRLNKNGKKSQLLLRLALWARDEITKAVPYPDDEKDEGIPSDDPMGGDDGRRTSERMPEDSESSDGSESSDDELEFFEDVSPNEEKCLEDDDDDDDDDNSARLSGLLDHAGDTKSKLVSTLKSIFGYSEFRDGQEWAIQRCLAGKRSLLVAPTGSGKSLCYSLPAALMDGVCVVVSPLISLIQDQLRSLPPRVPAATLSGSISVSATAAIIDDVVRKRIKILFVSPERLTSPSFRRLFHTTWNPDTQKHERRFPEISLLCVDEAHCVSQWAHNFRPCFLRFQRLLQLMEPRSVLAVTATAGSRVIGDITSVLGIDTTSQIDEEASGGGKENNVLIIDKPRYNIDISCQFVESHEERLEMLSRILKSKSVEKTSKKNNNKYAGVLASGSVIVYVWRQRDTEIVAENLISSGVKGGIVMYHGGMDASSRTRAQSKFMRGKARICVATVAFGMGIDKADVEGIVHMNISSSPEHYIQEIGRAGRDGRQAKAIALPTVEEIPVRHSLAHSNFISKSQIVCLLYSMRTIVLECDSNDGLRSLSVALPIERLMLECDLKAETIETLLSILEQNGGESPLLHVEGFNYDSATVAMKKRSIENLAEKEPVAASIIRVGVCCEQPIGEMREDTPSSTLPEATAFPRHFLAYSKGSYAFSVAKCANALGQAAESRHVFAALRRLQASGELELALDTSSKGRVFMLKTSGSGPLFFSAKDFDQKAEEVSSLLHESFTTSIISGASKVLDMNVVLNNICDQPSDRGEPKELTAGPSESTLKFQEMMSRYFGKGLQDDMDTATTNLAGSFSTVGRRELENDLHAILRDLPVLVIQAPQGSNHCPVLGDSKFSDYTAVTVTKFLHGLDSPRVPFKAFQSHHLFGKWRQNQFCIVLDAVRGLLQYPA